MADSTLAAIRTKVRKLTRSPTESLLSTFDLDQYINTFVQYDFPEHLRLFSLKTTFSFFAQPNVDTYVPSTDINNPLFEFDQRYITFEGPVFVSGQEASLTQSREEFYRVWPYVNSIINTQLVGNGVNVGFNGTLSQTPILQGQVLFTVKDANNAGLILSDNDRQLVTPNVGLLTSTDGVSTGTINYLTGAFTLNWGTPPALSQPIFAEIYPYSPGYPTMMLYYDDQFVLRPIPDKAYKVTLDAYIRPTELLATNQSPELQQWWQYIAYGAAKKIFEDRTDMESVQMILPEFNKQERLVLRRTIVQQANERIATIYTTQVAPSGFNPYGNPF